MAPRVNESVDKLNLSRVPNSYPLREAAGVLCPSCGEPLYVARRVEESPCGRMVSSIVRSCARRGCEYAETI